MLLIQNAHIKTMAGEDLPNGCLLVEDGKIAALGKDLDEAQAQKDKLAEAVKPLLA